MMRRWPRMLLGAMIVATAAACGVPSDSPLVAITVVPYDLLSPASTATTRPTALPTRGPFVYLLGGDERLVPIESGAVAGEPVELLTSILSRLASGPTDEERGRGLSTALGSDVALTLHRLENGRAEIELDAGAQAMPARRLPLAVGQVVLSVTSIPGIDSVVLTNNGTPFDAPLPGGALTDHPLSAGDYQVFVAPRQARAPSTPR